MTAGEASDARDDGGFDGYEPVVVDVDGRSTRYYDVGSGDPIVLVHGGRPDGASNANVWTMNFEALAAEHRVLAFDRFACGLTDTPVDPDEFVFDTEVDHALGFLDAVGVETCHLVGASRGGALAACLAVEAPDRLASLTLTNSGSFGPDAGDFHYRRDRLLTRNRPDDLDPYSAAGIRYSYEQTSYRTDHVTEAYCRTAAALRNRESSRRARELLTTEPAGERWNETKAAAIRDARRAIEAGCYDGAFQYCFGRNDLTLRLESGVAALDLVGQHAATARLVVYNRCGHYPYREHPRAFERDLLGFIDGLA